MFRGAVIKPAIIRHPDALIVPHLERLEQTEAPFIQKCLTAVADVEGPI